MKDRKEGREVGDESAWLAKLRGAHRSGRDLGARRDDVCCGKQLD